MATPDVKGRRVAILATDGFEQIELTSPREALDNAGATCVVVSPKDGQIQGFKHHDKADTVKVDLSLSKADPSLFDAVLLPGGVINGDALRIEKKAQQFVQEMDRAGKPVFVICHGPWLLVSAGLVKGRHMTSWPTLQDDIRNAGGNWEDQTCIRDRNWISSRKPDDLSVFNEEIVKCLSDVAAGAGLKRENRDRSEVRQ
jgi:protease I